MKKTLHDRLQINSLRLKNRFVRASVWMKAADGKGHLTEELMEEYRKLAEGGVGLILTGYAYITEEDKPNPGMMGIYDDSFIEEFRPFTEMIHESGSKVALQIAYGGAQTNNPHRDTMRHLGPSAVQNPVSGITPEEASVSEIRRIVGLFGDAASRAKSAGFDAVEIHAAHGYFLSAFLSPYFNRRADEYHGSIHDRARILYEVYEEVRNRVGDDFPVIFKINCQDFMDPREGLEPDEALEVFKHLDTLGVDMFEVSGVNESSGKGLAPARMRLNSIEKESYFREETARIAEAVQAPVILMGGNRTPELMDEILNTTEITLFSLGRPLLCEPDLITRWAADPGYRPRCVSCNRCWETTPNSCIFHRETRA